MEVKLWQKLNPKQDNKRRYSLVDRPFHKNIYSHRQQLKSKYHEYIQQRQTSLESHEGDSFSDTKSNLTEQFKMPKINSLIRERHDIAQVLRTTLNKYNYIKNCNEKKTKQLTLKKNKYEKILKIRQNRHQQKMELNHSRALLEKSISQEKKSMRQTVLKSKTGLKKSIVRCMNQKRDAGSETRYFHSLNKSRIDIDRQIDLQQRKRTHNILCQSEKRAKVNKNKQIQIKRRIVTQQYYHRIDKQLQKNKQLNKKAINKKSKVAKKIQQLNKSKQKYERQLQEYRKILKQKPISSQKSKNNNHFFSTSTGIANSQQI